MNKFGEMSLVLLLVAACLVSGDVQTSTPCSLSFYRYLFNLPGEKIRPNVPEGTYVFGKRVGPANQEGQASEFQPSVLKAAQTYEAPLYLPPPKPTTTTTTTTPRPTTSAPLYIPPASPSPYYPAEASNTVTVVQPAKPDCEHPEHHPIQSGLVPPFRFNPQPAFPAQTTFQTLPTFQPQPTFFVPKYEPVPQKSVVVASANDIFVSQQKPVQAPVHRFPVPTPPPQFLRPYSQPTAAPVENCDRHHVASTTPVPWTTPESLVETRQNEIVILPESVPAPHKAADCGHKEHVAESIGVPSTDYGVVASSGSSIQSASAGYSYDKPSQPLAYPSNIGYSYPKPSPSFEYPGASPYSAQATVLFESESPKSSAAGGTEDGDLVILKV